MPIYEYFCPECEARFEQLLPVARMDDPAPCPQGHLRAGRVLSTFASLTRNDVAAPAVTGGGCGGGCTNCACAN